MVRRKVMASPCDRLADGGLSRERHRFTLPLTPPSIGTASTRLKPFTAGHGTVFVYCSGNSIDFKRFPHYRSGVPFRCTVQVNDRKL